MTAQENGSMNHNYTLRFLPLFQEDLNALVDHIALQLRNPEAADRLVNDVEKAILDRLSQAEAFAPYPVAAAHPLPYYCIQVRNYLIFYVVIGDVMEVRRIIYSRRDMTEQL